MTEEKENKGFQILDEMIKKGFEEIVMTAPASMRGNYFANTISKAVEKGVDIDYQKVRELINRDLSKYDTNLFKDVHDYESLARAVFNAHAASIPTSPFPWQTHICCDCHNAFYMYYNEVKFFEEKGFEIPKRCKTCRDNRKKVR